MIKYVGKYLPVSCLVEMMKHCCEGLLVASAQEEIFECDLLLVRKIAKTTNLLIKKGANFDCYLYQNLVLKITPVVIQAAKKDEVREEKKRIAALIELLKIH